MIKLVLINGKKQKEFVVKILDKLFKLMREDTGVSEAAGSESLEQKRETAACRRALNQAHRSEMKWNMLVCFNTSSGSTGN